MDVHTTIPQGIVQRKKYVMIELKTKDKPPACQSEHGQCSMYRRRGYHCETCYKLYVLCLPPICKHDDARSRSRCSRCIRCKRDHGYDGDPIGCDVCLDHHDDYAKHLDTIRMRLIKEGIYLD